MPRIGLPELMPICTHQRRGVHGEEAYALLCSHFTADAAQMMRIRSTTRAKSAPTTAIVTWVRPTPIAIDIDEEASDKRLFALRKGWYSTPNAGKNTKKTAVGSWIQQSVFSDESGVKPSA